jgi:hypothetical protein
MSHNLPERGLIVLGKSDTDQGPLAAMPTTVIPPHTGLPSLNSAMCRAAGTAALRRAFPEA